MISSKLSFEDLLRILQIGLYLEVQSSVGECIEIGSQELEILEPVQFFGVVSKMSVLEKRAVEATRIQIEFEEFQTDPPLSAGVLSAEPEGKEAIRFFLGEGVGFEVTSFAQVAPESFGRKVQ